MFVKLLKHGNVYQKGNLDGVMYRSSAAHFGSDGTIAVILQSSRTDVVSECFPLKVITVHVFKYFTGTCNPYQHGCSDTYGLVLPKDPASFAS